MPLKHAGSLKDLFLREVDFTVLSFVVSHCCSWAALKTGRSDGELGFVTRGEVNRKANGYLT